MTKTSTSSSHFVFHVMNKQMKALLIIMIQMQLGVDYKPKKSILAMSVHYFTSPSSAPAFSSAITLRITELDQSSRCLVY